MGRERNGKSPVEVRFAEFLRENYPVKKDEVKDLYEAMTEQSERDGRSVFDTTKYHVELVIDLAKRGELMYSGANDDLYLSSHLKALSKFAKDNYQPGQINYEVSLSLQARVLAIAEAGCVLRLTGVYNVPDKDLINEHLEKYRKLLDFCGKLK